MGSKDTKRAQGGRIFRDGEYTASVKVLLQKDMEDVSPEELEVFGHEDRKRSRRFNTNHFLVLAQYLASQRPLFGGDIRITPSTDYSRQDRRIRNKNRMTGRKLLMSAKSKRQAYSEKVRRMGKVSGSANSGASLGSRSCRGYAKMEKVSGLSKDNKALFREAEKIIRERVKV